MTFGEARMGKHIQLEDPNGEWMPSVQLVEDPQRCEGSCCTALVLVGPYGTPFLLHAAADAEVRLAPRDAARIVRGDR